MSPATATAQASPRPSGGAAEVVGHAGRYLAVGVVNTLVYYGGYLGLRELLPYLAAHALALAVALVGSFFLNTCWTFRSRPTWRKFLLFPLTNVTNVVATTVGVVVLVEMLRVDQRLAPILAAGLAVPVTFVLSRWILHDGPARAAEPRR